MDKKNNNIINPPHAHSLRYIFSPLFLFYISVPFPLQTSDKRILAFSFQLSKYDYEMLIYLDVECVESKKLKIYREPLSRF
jgi:hypothetical protein